MFIRFSKETVIYMVLAVSSTILPYSSVIYLCRLSLRHTREVAFSFTQSGMTLRILRVHDLRFVLFSLFTLERFSGLLPYKE